MEFERDYEKLGLKCGLEIHQQLDSKKLFCCCPSLLRKDEPDFRIKRKLHSVAGESGGIDVAVEYQTSLDRNFIYEGYETTCLVELDESPPREINKDSLMIALHISLLLNCKIIPLSQIMRKIVVDGSNTSGFQRSVLIARDGEIETPQGKVGISWVYLEEDAARKISEDEDGIVYRLDRLGIPLVEIVTAPDIKTPEQAKDVALHIGKILRMCKVKRGIGTIRQDINVSIKGHPRAEIKGFQDPKIFVKVVEKEVERQSKNLESNKKNLFSEVRGANSDGTTRYLRPLSGSARMYPETDLPLLKISKKIIDEVKRTLPKPKKEKEELEKKGLNRELISLLFKQNKLEYFKEFLEIFDNPILVGKILLVFPKEISSREKISLKRVEKILNKDVLERVLEGIKKGKFLESDVKNILGEIVRKGKYDEGDFEIKKEGVAVLEEKIRNIIKGKPGLSENAYMGLVMKEFKGKISGKGASEIIRKYLKLK